MPTGKTGWFVVKGQTVEQLVVVGRTKASNSSGSREIVLYVVVPGHRASDCPQRGRL